MVDKAYALLRERNHGLTPDGKTFGEVMPFFVLGGDETCLLASGGDVTIIGDKEKKKHQARLRITVHTANALQTDPRPPALTSSYHDRVRHRCTPQSLG